MTSVLLLYLFMKIPGSDKLKAIEIKLVRTPKKVIDGTISDRNQVFAILLGALKMKIPPIAESRDPNRQTDELDSRNILIHIPPTTNTAEI